MKRGQNLFHDFGLQLLALYLLLIIPFLVTLVVFDSLIGVRIRQDVQASDLSLAQSISQEVDLAISKALSVVEGLATFPGVIRADPHEMESAFSVIFGTSADINLVYRLDADGIMVYHFPAGPGSTVGDDFSFREYFRRARMTRDSLVSVGRISPTTDQAVTTAVMPIWSEEDEFHGLVGANIKLESLSLALTAIVSEHQAEEGLQVVILDSADQVIAHVDPSLLLQPADAVLPPEVCADSRTGQSSLILVAPDGGERLYTHLQVSAANWEVVVSRPTRSAFGTQLMLRRIVQVAAVTFLLIGLVFWGTLTFRVLRPIERLAPISEAIGLNQPISREDQKHLQRGAGRNDQIGHLIRSIMRMRDSIEERMKEQATLLETSGAVVSSLDPHTVLDRILEQMGRLLRLQMYAVIALDQEQGTFRIQASRGLSKRFTEQLSILPTEPDSVTMRALHAGQPIQVSDTERDPSYVVRKQRARAEGYRAILAVPLNTQHAPPTALLVFHPTPHVYTPNEIQLLSSFANHAAMAIENALLYERSDMQLRVQTQRLEALVQSLRDGLILSDLDGRVLYANRRVGVLAGLPSRDLAGMFTDQILSSILTRSSGIRPTKNRLLRIMGRREGGSAELSLTLPEGTLHLRLEAFSVNHEDGAPIGRGIFFHDVTTDRELDRMRSSLVSTVSHELRTPLAAIKGYASTLLAEDVEWDRGSQHEFLTIISDESDRLTNLVNNLLDLSRIEAGSLKLARRECDILKTIDRSLAHLCPEPAGRIDIQVEPGLPALYADPLRLESVFRNLFENAIKYAGDAAKIRLRVTRIDREILIQVKDDGPGIPPAERKRVFDRFYRVDDSLARPTGGAGLGLAICQGIVRAHGGRIWVEAELPGTCISFTLPIESPAPRKKPGPTGKGRR